MIFIVAKSQGQLIAAIQTALTLKKLGEVDIDIVTTLPVPKGVPVNIVKKSEFKIEVSAGDHFFKLPKKTPRVYTGKPYISLDKVKKDFDGLGMLVASSNHTNFWKGIGIRAVGKNKKGKMNVFYSIDALKQRL